MYVIVKYELTKDDGKGGTTFSPVEIVDTSETIGKFSHLITNKKKILDELGSVDVSNLYNGHKKILMNLVKLEKKHGTLHVIRGLIRKYNLEILLY